MAFYADDTGLMAVAKQTQTIINRLHNGMNTCNKYFRKWKIQLNTSKTQAIIFPFNKSPKRKPTTSLLFDDDEIKFTDSATYLGFDLDKQLTFKPHIEKAAEKGTKCIRSLYPLLSNKQIQALTEEQKYYLQINHSACNDLWMSSLASSSCNTHQKTPNSAK